MDSTETYYLSIENALDFYDGERDTDQELILEGVAAIEKASFSEPWSVESLENTLRYDYNKLLIAKSSVGNITEIVGYLLYNEIADETELLRIAVDGNYRGRGIGRQLIDFYIRESENRFEKGFLEVRKTNAAARKLYEKAGYSVLQTRKDYYSNPTEDGVMYMINFENVPK